MFFYDWTDWLSPNTWLRFLVGLALIPVSYSRVTEQNLKIFQRRGYPKR